LFIGACFVFLLTFWFDSNGRWLHLYSCLWGAQYTVLNPMWRFRVEGERLIDRRRAYVFCSNHQSLGDIPVLFRLFIPFKFVSKQSNFRLPFFGWNMHMNRYVPLIRGDGDSVDKMMRTCELWLRRG